MPPFGPIKRADLIRALRAAGFSAPEAGGKHAAMRRGGTTLVIPNPCSEEIQNEIGRRQRSVLGAFADALDGVEEPVSQDFRSVQGALAKALENFKHVAASDAVVKGGNRISGHVGWNEDRACGRFRYVFQRMTQVTRRVTQCTAN